MDRNDPNLMSVEGHQVRVIRAPGGVGFSVPDHLGEQEAARVAQAAWAEYNRSSRSARW